MLVELLFCSKYVGRVVVLFEVVGSVVVVFIKVCWYSCCSVRIMLVVLLFLSKYVGIVVVFVRSILVVLLLKKKIVIELLFCSKYVCSVVVLIKIFW